jgi:hypothetical protein
MDRSEFTPLERAVIEMFLAGELPALRTLSEQFKASRPLKREFTGVGFFTYFDVPASAPRVIYPDRVSISDVDASIDGLQNGAGFVLFVREGTLQMLEGFTYDQPWPREIDKFSLQYSKVPRDLSALAE